MEKQTIYSISNKEDFVCYELGKKEYFFKFLLKLLDEFSIRKPDLYDEEGKLPNIKKYVDFYESYENKDTLIHVIYGFKRVFLLIRTDLREKLVKFMETNADFKSA